MKMMPTLNPFYRDIIKREIKLAQMYRVSARDVIKFLNLKLKSH